MRTIVIISSLTILIVLTACTIGDLSSSRGDPNISCLENDCETRPPHVTSTAFTSVPIATPAPGSRSYYVSKQGKDTNSGMREFPFQTISKAAAIAKAGDVILIQAGVYLEEVHPLNSGVADKYIIYQNAGDGEVIIDAQNGRRDGCLVIDNKSYLQFIGLTVRGAKSFPVRPRAGISMTDGTHHVILDNITAYDNYIGIMAYGRDNPVRYVTVKNSKTFGPGNLGNIHYGIFFYEKVYDSNIIGNHAAYSLPEVQSYGIEISTDYPDVQSHGSRRIVITGNEVDHNESQGIHTWNAVGLLIADNYLHDNGATGIQIEDGSENVVIENNLSENNAQKYEFETGAWIDGSKNVLVRYNILRSNKIGLTITSSNRVIVHDNYIYFNNRGAENLDNAAGLIVEDSATNIAVTHNTFYKNGATSNERGAVNFGLFNPTCSSITFKNNIVANTANPLDLLQDSCVSFVSDFNDFYNTRPLAVMWNQSQMDWQTYQSTSGQDKHSLTDEPNFADPARYDFSLKAKSPLIDRGTILAWTTTAGSGDTLSISDPSYFSDGFGIGAGDLIVINGNRAHIVSIDYTGQKIKIDRSINWSENSPVSFPFTGNAPDIGVSEVH